MGGSWNARAIPCKVRSEHNSNNELWSEYKDDSDMVMVVAVAANTAFENGVVVGSINRIRPDWTWIKPNLVVGLKNLLGSQELEPSRTNNMAWMSELGKAETRRIAW